MENLTEVMNVSYRCSHCNFLFTKLLPSNNSVSGSGGKCPNCEKQDGIPGHPTFEYTILQQKAKILME